MSVSSSYTIKFSDPTKLDEVVIPPYPPGINTVDTSLSLVGKNYPNYGEKIASNFVHLLENFAGPIPPENPIEGQLWYDTSDPTNKVLRIMDGTASSARWPSVNRFYQQSEDPKASPSLSLKNGDIWVDTAYNQLKIYSRGNWILVGPTSTNSSTVTGPAVIELQDNNTNETLPVIVNYVNGISVSVISSHNEFIPKSQSPSLINGFTSIKPGINLASLEDTTITFNGTAVTALNLEVNNLSYSADKFLRKDDQTLNGQIITGRILFRTPSNQSGAQGRDGVVIITAAENDTTNYIQFYKSGSDAVILNNKASGKILFKTKPSSNAGLFDTVTIENKSVGINTSTNSLSPALDVYGDVKISQTLNLISTSTSSLILSGGSIIQKSVRVNENLSVTGTTVINGQLKLGTSSGSGAICVPENDDTYDLGSSTKYFRSIYVSNIIGAGITLPGMIIPYGSTTEPSGWLKCDGQSYSTSSYTALFSVIGYSYGGSESTFNVPSFASSAANGTINYIIKT